MTYRILGPGAGERGVSRTPDLVMTDYGVLLALCLAWFMATDFPGWRLERISFTKHLPGLLGLASFALAWVATQMAPKPLPSGAIRLNLPWILLAAFIIAGSVAARVFLDTRNTFLIAGMYMLWAPVMTFVLLSTRQPERLLRYLAGFMILGGILVLLEIAWGYGTRDIQHEKQFLLVPLALYFVLRPERRAIHWLGALSFLVMAPLLRKNTAYLMGLLTLSYFVTADQLPRWTKLDPLKRAVRLYGLLLFVMCAGALIAYLVWNRDKYLPTGNPQFRLFTYARAWERFLESPLWGTGFSAAGTEKFTEFNTGVANNILATHSDVLDMFANGGLVAIFLWLWGLLRSAKFIWNAALRPGVKSTSLTRYVHLFGCISIGGVLTYAFNPIFLQPARAMLLWAALGVAIGVAALIQRDQAGLGGRN